MIFLRVIMPVKMGCSLCELVGFDTGAEPADLAALFFKKSYYIGWDFNWFFPVYERCVDEVGYNSGKKSSQVSVSLLGRAEEIDFHFARGLFHFIGQGCNAGFAFGGSAIERAA